MLVDFNIENYLSFKNKNRLNLRAGSIKELRDSNTFIPTTASSEYLLKSIGIFGANGSGKSNILKALAFMKNFVLNSSKESNSVSEIPVQPFLLSTISNQKSCTFELTFIISEGRFRYGFSVDKKQVQSEWLFKSEKNNEEKIFIRAEQNYTFNKNFKNSNKDRLEIFTDLTRQNALFASVMSQFNHPIFQSISNWFDGIFIAPSFSNIGLIDFTANLMNNLDYRSLINSIITNADLGIEGIEEVAKEGGNEKNSFRNFLQDLTYETESIYTILTKHNVFDDGNNLKGLINFDLHKNESLGTQKFFGILGPILWALKERKVLVIDEVDARLHSLLVEQIVSLFNSGKYNPNGAQLIFTSHNINLIKKGLRRDQMVFTEKDKFGSSQVFSLHDKKPQIRNDASFDKDYILGRYGAIPKINSQLGLFDSIE